MHHLVLHLGVVGKRVLCQPRRGRCTTGESIWVRTVAYLLQIKRRYKVTSVYSDPYEAGILKSCIYKKVR